MKPFLLPLVIHPASLLFFCRYPLVQHPHTLGTAHLSTEIQPHPFPPKRVSGTPLFQPIEFLYSPMKNVAKSFNNFPGLSPTFDPHQDFPPSALPLIIYSRLLLP